MTESNTAAYEMDDEYPNSAPKMGKMVGRLGWHGQCSCCCGPDDPSTVKAQEKREWRDGRNG